MPKISYGKDLIEINKPLDSIDLRLIMARLSLMQKLVLKLSGYCYLITAQPQGFTAPMGFYLVKGAHSYFISYKQGLRRVFFDVG